MAKEPLGSLSTPDTNSDNTWTRTNRFLGLLIANLLQIPPGAVVGKVLRCANLSGGVEWTDKPPATSVAAENGGASGVVDTLVTGAGEYLVSVHHNVESAGGSGQLDTSLTFSDESGTHTIFPVVSIPLTAVGFDQAVVTVRVVSGGIDYAIAPSAAGATWNVFLTAVKIRG